MTMVLLALAVPLAGCGAEPPPTVGPTGSRAAGVADPGATCPAATGVATEVPGVADTGHSFWALLFPRGGPSLHSGREEKIVWRMTGSGSFSVQATGPDGVTVEPVWGPTRHDGSTWTRPGDEWGTGWNFPAAGCWTVRASRSSGATGSLVLRVG
ncbi:hypothetical protein [Plantactinospora sp. BB1]|uniref:hypothetical protein n=1 Tax=Plantactinospora sp. BB1 TaxID=2071627 RepID=UPI000D156903|nr:hypothetical protein [Plantactinospora sp. BB1]AVT38983.1 hypothetical protein C6W10_23950 [Plantactinospora sp. BB1]